MSLCDQAREKIDRVRALAAEEGRTVRFGIRFHVIVRDTEAEAWDEAHRLISKVTPEAIAKAQSNLERYESVGQQRMRALHGGDPARLMVGPNLWAGIGLVRGYAGTALVGDGDSSRPASVSTRTSVSTASSCQATRISKKPIDLQISCSPGLASAPRRRRTEKFSPITFQPAPIKRTGPPARYWLKRMRAEDGLVS